MADEVGKSCKLFVRHLPSVLSSDDKISLLKHFGAKDVICMGSKGRMRDSAFAEFKTVAQAEKALSRLHQLEILGSRLVVQYARKQHENMAAKQNRRMSPPPPHPEHKQQQDEKDDPTEESDSENKDQSDQERFGSAIPGIAPKVGLNYPMNPHLTYVYPPPSTAILTNIAHALACVPKFYVQVLHLMNKMNLPAPFGVVTPSPPLSEMSSHNIQPPEPVDKQSSSDESEIESDEEDRQLRRKTKEANKRQAALLQKPAKRRKLQTVLPLKPSIPARTSTKQQPVEEAFEKANQQPKKIEFKLTEAITNIFESAPPVIQKPKESEGFGVFAPPLEEVTMETENDIEESDQYISLSQLNAERKSNEEILALPSFKKYTPGEPTERLYLKNLSKQVEKEDLIFIFGRYMPKDTPQDSFDIKLMKEGRMKGQAFIGLPCEKIAARALRETHGYILHGKPIVIQFARSSKPKE